MSEHPVLDPKAGPTIEQLGRFWLFKRRELSRKLLGYLDAFQRHVEHLQQAHGQLQDHSKAQAVDIRRLNEQVETLSFDLAQLTGRFEQLSASHAELHEQYAKEQARCGELSRLLNRALADCEQWQRREAEASARGVELEQCLSSLRVERAMQQQNLELLERQAQAMRSAQAGLHAQFQALSDSHLSLSEKFGLVQSILSLRAPESVGLARFGQLIQAEYRSFAARESSLADEAGALLALQEIHRELKRIVDFPGMCGKTILAIAGGFSSGKSRFINSYIQGQAIKLSVGINPVTAVPSYVVCAEQPRIRGYCSNGGSLELSQRIYEGLGHEYNQSLGFDLRTLMPFVSVEAPMDPALFEHLCLIDTPGYNPGGGDGREADRVCAQKAVGQAQAMVWVVDPEKGTLTTSDLDFIEQTGLFGESLYILLNKADVPCAADIESIMEQLELGLATFGLEVAGIGAYSSLQQRAYGHRGQSLEAFLQYHNRRQDVMSSLEGKIDAVFDLYKVAIKRDIKALTAQRKRIERLKFDALEQGGTEHFELMSELCSSLEAELQPAGLQALQRECEKLRKVFKAAAQQTVAEVLHASTAAPA